MHSKPGGQKVRSKQTPPRSARPLKSQSHRHLSTSTRKRLKFIASIAIHPNQSQFPSAISPSIVPPRASFPLIPLSYHLNSLHKIYFSTNAKPPHKPPSSKQLPNQGQGRFPASPPTSSSSKPPHGQAQHGRFKSPIPHASQSAPVGAVPAAAPPPRAWRASISVTSSTSPPTSQRSSPQDVLDEVDELLLKSTSIPPTSQSPLQPSSKPASSQSPTGYIYKGTNIDPDTVEYSHLSQKYGVVLFATNCRPKNDIYRVPINVHTPRGEVSPHSIQFIAQTVTNQQQYHKFAESILQDLQQHFANSLEFFHQTSNSLSTSAEVGHNNQFSTKNKQDRQQWRKSMDHSSSDVSTDKFQDNQHFLSNFSQYLYPIPKLDEYDGSSLNDDVSVNQSNQTVFRKDKNVLPTAAMTHITQSAMYTRAAYSLPPHSTLKSPSSPSCTIPVYATNDSVSQRPSLETMSKHEINHHRHIYPIARALRLLSIPSTVNGLSPTPLHGEIYSSILNFLVTQYPSNHPPIEAHFITWLAHNMRCDNALSNSHQVAQFIQLFGKAGHHIVLFSFLDAMMAQTSKVSKAIRLSLLPQSPNAEQYRHRLNLMRFGLPALHPPKLLLYAENDDTGSHHSLTYRKVIASDIDLDTISIKELGLERKPRYDEDRFRQLLEFEQNLCSQYQTLLKQYPTQLNSPQALHNSETRKAIQKSLNSQREHIISSYIDFQNDLLSMQHQAAMLNDPLLKNDPPPTPLSSLNFNLMSPTFSQLHTQDLFRPTIESFDALISAFIDAQAPNLIPYVLHKFQSHPDLGKHQRAQFYLNISSSLLKVGDCVNAIPYLQSIIQQKIPVSNEQINQLVSDFADQSSTLFSTNGLPIAHYPVKSDSANSKSMIGDKDATKVFKKTVDGFNFLVDQRLVRSFHHMQRPAFFKVIRGVISEFNTTRSNPLNLQSRILYPDGSRKQKSTLRAKARTSLRNQFSHKNVNNIIDVMIATQRNDNARSRFSKLVSSRIQVRSKLSLLTRKRLKRLRQQLQHRSDRLPSLSLSHSNAHQMFNLTRFQKSRTLIKMSKHMGQLDYADNVDKGQLYMDNLLLSEYNPRRRIQRIATTRSIAGTNKFAFEDVVDQVNPFNWNTPSVQTFSDIFSKQSLINPTASVGNKLKPLITVDSNDIQQFCSLSPNQVTTLVHIVSCLQHIIGIVRQQRLTLEAATMTKVFKFLVDAGLHGEASHLLGLMLAQQFSSKFKHTPTGLDDGTEGHDNSTLHPYLNYLKHSNDITSQTTPMRHLLSSLLDDFLSSTQLYESDIVHSFQHAQRISALIKDIDLLIFKNESHYQQDQTKFYADHVQPDLDKDQLTQQTEEYARTHSAHNSYAKLQIEEALNLDQTTATQLDDMDSFVPSNEIEDYFSPYRQNTQQPAQQRQNNNRPASPSRQGKSKPPPKTYHQQILSTLSGEVKNKRLEVFIRHELTQIDSMIATEIDSILKEEFATILQSTASSSDGLLTSLLTGIQTEKDRNNQAQLEKSRNKQSDPFAPRFPMRLTEHNATTPERFSKFIRSFTKRKVLTKLVKLSEDDREKYIEDLKEKRQHLQTKLNNFRRAAPKLTFDLNGSKKQSFSFDRETLLNPKLLQTLHPLLFKRRELAINSALQRGFQAKLLFILSSTKPTALVTFPMPDYKPSESGSPSDFVTRDALDDLQRIRDRYLLHVISLRPQHPETLPTSLTIQRQHLNTLRAIAPDALLNKHLRQTHDNSLPVMQLHEMGYDTIVNDPTIPVKPFHPYDLLQNHLKSDLNNNSRNMNLSDSLSLDVVPLLYLSTAKEAMEYAHKHYTPKPVSVLDWTGIQFPAPGKFHVLSAFRQLNYQQFESFKMFDLVLKYQRLYSILTNANNYEAPARHNISSSSRYLGDNTFDDDDDNHGTEYDSNTVDPSTHAFNPSLGFKILRLGFQSPGHQHKIKNALQHMVLTCDDVLVSALKQHADLHSLDYDTVGLCYICPSTLEQTYLDKLQYINGTPREDLITLADIEPDRQSSLDEVGPRSPYVFETLPIYSYYDEFARKQNGATKLAIIFHPGKDFIASLSPSLCFDPQYSSLLKTSLTVHNDPGYLLHTTRALAYSLGISLNGQSQYQQAHQPQPQGDVIVYPSFEEPITDLTNEYAVIAGNQSYERLFTQSVIQRSIQNLKSHPLFLQLQSNPKLAENMLGVISSFALLISQSNHTMIGSSRPDTIFFHDNNYNHWAASQHRLSTSYQHSQYQNYLAQYYSQQLTSHGSPKQQQQQQQQIQQPESQTFTKLNSFYRPDTGSTQLKSASEQYSNQDTSVSAYFLKLLRSFSAHTESFYFKTPLIPTSSIMSTVSSKPLFFPSVTAQSLIPNATAGRSIHSIEAPSQIAHASSVEILSGIASPLSELRLELLTNISKPQKHITSKPTPNTATAKSSPWAFPGFSSLLQCDENQLNLSFKFLGDVPAAIQRRKVTQTLPSPLDFLIQSNKALRDSSSKTNPSSSTDLDRWSAPNESLLESLVKDLSSTTATTTFRNFNAGIFRYRGSSFSTHTPSLVTALNDYRRYKRVLNEASVTAIAPTYVLPSLSKRNHSRLQSFKTKPKISGGSHSLRDVTKHEWQSAIAKVNKTSFMGRYRQRRSFVKQRYQLSNEIIRQTSRFRDSFEHWMSSANKFAHLDKFSRFDSEPGSSIVRFPSSNLSYGKDDLDAKLAQLLPKWWNKSAVEQYPEFAQMSTDQLSSFTSVLDAESRHNLSNPQSVMQGNISLDDEMKLIPTMDLESASDSPSESEEQDLTNYTLDDLGEPIPHIPQSRLQPLAFYGSLLDRYYFRVQNQHHNYLLNPTALSFLHNNLTAQQEYEEILLQHVSSLTTSLIVDQFTTLTKELFNLIDQKDENVPIQSIIELTNLCSIQPRGITPQTDSNIFTTSDYIVLPKERLEHPQKELMTLIDPDFIDPIILSEADLDALDIKASQSFQTDLVNEVQDVDPQTGEMITRKVSTPTVFTFRTSSRDSETGLHRLMDDSRDEIPLSLPPAQGRGNDGPEDADVYTDSSSEYFTENEEACYHYHDTSDQYLHLPEAPAAIQHLPQKFQQQQSLIVCHPVRSIVFQQILATIYPDSYNPEPIGGHVANETNSSSVPKQAITPEVCDLIMNILQGNVSPEQLSVVAPRLAFNLRNQSATSSGSSYVLSNGVVANHISTTNAVTPNISSSLPVVSQRLKTMPLTQIMREFRDSIEIEENSALDAQTDTDASSNTETDSEAWSGAGKVKYLGTHATTAHFGAKDQHTLFASRSRSRRGIVELIQLHSMAKSATYRDMLPSDVRDQLDATFSGQTDPDAYQSSIKSTPEHFRSKQYRYQKLLTSAPILDDRKVIKKLTFELAATHATRLNQVFSHNLIQTSILPSARVHAIDTLVRITQSYRAALSARLSSKQTLLSPVISATNLSQLPSGQDLVLDKQTFSLAELTSATSHGLFALHSQYVLSLARMGCSSATLNLLTEIFIRNSIPSASKAEKTDLLNTLFSVFETRGDFASSMVLFRSFVHVSPATSYSSLDDLTVADKFGYNKFDNQCHAYHLRDSALTSLLSCLKHADRPVVLDTILDVLLYARRGNGISRTILHEVFGTLQHHGFVAEGMDLFMTMADPYYMYKIITRDEQVQHDDDSGDKSKDRPIDFKNAQQGNLTPEAAAPLPATTNPFAVRANLNRPQAEIQSQQDNEREYNQLLQHANSAAKLHSDILADDLVGVSFAQSKKFSQTDLSLVASVVENSINSIPIPNPDQLTPPALHPHRARRGDTRPDEKLDIQQLTQKQIPMHLIDDKNFDSELDPSMIPHLQNSTQSNIIIDGDVEAENQFDISGHLSKQAKKAQVLKQAASLGQSKSIFKDKGDYDSDFESAYPLDQMLQAQRQKLAQLQHINQSPHVGDQSTADGEHNNVIAAMSSPTPSEASPDDDMDFQFKKALQTGHTDKDSAVTGIDTRTYSLSPKFPIITNVPVIDTIPDVLSDGNNDPFLYANPTNHYTPTSFIFAFAHLFLPVGPQRDHKVYGSKFDQYWGPNVIVTPMPTVKAATFKALLDLFAASPAPLTPVAIQLFSAFSPPETYKQYVQQLHKISELKRQLEDFQRKLLDHTIPPTSNSRQLYDSWLAHPPRLKQVKGLMKGLRKTETQILQHQELLPDAELNSTYRAANQIIRNLKLNEPPFINGHYIIDGNTAKSYGCAGSGPVFPRQNEKRYFVLPFPGTAHSPARVTEEIVASFIGALSNPNSEFSAAIQGQGPHQLTNTLHNIVMLTKQRRIASLRETQERAAQPPEEDHSPWAYPLQDSEHENDDSFDAETDLSCDINDGNLDDSQGDHGSAPQHQLARSTHGAGEEEAVAEVSIDNDPQFILSHSKSHKFGKLQPRINPLSVSAHNPATSSSTLSSHIATQLISYQSTKIEADQRVRTLARLDPSYQILANYQSRFYKRNWHLGMFEQLYALNYPTEWLHQRRRQQSGLPFDTRSSAIQQQAQKRRTMTQNTQFIKNLWK